MPVNKLVYTMNLFQLEKLQSELNVVLKINYGIVHIFDKIYSFIA